MHMIDDDDVVGQPAPYAVNVAVRPVTEGRNRLTTAFRIFLAIPHLLIVGGPAAMGGWLSWRVQDGWASSTGTGVLGAAAAFVTLIAWLAILISGRHPDALWKLAAYYLRWRVRAIAYLTLMRDEYPPFGDQEYPAELVLEAPDPKRNRLTVFFRVLLALPHLFLLWLIGLLWAFTTALAWVIILVTGRYPETLYGFALGAFAWSTRVEAYVLLLRDDYPPFTLRV
jgi:hypothetical protein